MITRRTFLQGASAAAIAAAVSPTTIYEPEPIIFADGSQIALRSTISSKVGPHLTRFFFTWADGHTDTMDVWS